jgi:hypothetical protein
MKTSLFFWNCLQPFSSVLLCRTVFDLNNWKKCEAACAVSLQSELENIAARWYKKLALLYYSKEEVLQWYNFFATIINSLSP